jgi:antitoxin ParD1/3/4
MDINIVLPDEVRDYIEAQISIGAYRSVDEYFIDLVHQDQQRKAQAKLETLLQEGIDSDSQAVTSEYWQNLRRSVFEKHSETSDSL